MHFLPQLPPQNAKCARVKKINRAPSFHAVLSKSQCLKKNKKRLWGVWGVSSVKTKWWGAIRLALAYPPALFVQRMIFYTSEIGRFSYLAFPGRFIFLWPVPCSVRPRDTSHTGYVLLRCPCICYLPCAWRIQLWCDVRAFVLMLQVRPSGHML